MSPNPQGGERFGSTVVAFLLFLLGWLAVGGAKLARYIQGPGEYMVLDMLLPMVWLAGCSLAGIACAVYAVNRAEAGGYPMAVPLTAALLNLTGVFVPLWWFFG